MKPLPTTSTQWGETRRKSGGNTGAGGGGYFGSFATAMGGNAVSGGVAPLPSAATQWGANRRPSGGIDTFHRRRSAPARSGTAGAPSSPAQNGRKQHDSTEASSSEPAPGSPPSSPPDDDKLQLEAYAAASTSVEPVLNESSRTALATLHGAMIKAMASLNFTSAVAHFRQLRESCAKELQRLASVRDAHMELYMKSLAVRYSFLAAIDSFRDDSPRANGANVNLQQLSQDVVSEPDFGALFSEESKAHLMLATAEMYEGRFREAMASLVFAFNKADSADDICAEFKLEENVIGLKTTELRTAELRLNAGSSDLVVGRFADVRQMRLADVSTKSTGLNRATLVFADPFVLALFYRALAASQRVVEVSNKHGAQDGGAVLVTIDLDGSGWLVQVELELEMLDLVRQQMELPSRVAATTNMIELLELASFTGQWAGRRAIGETVSGTGDATTGTTKP